MTHGLDSQWEEPSITTRPLRRNRTAAFAAGTLTAQPSEPDRTHPYRALLGRLSDAWCVAVVCWVGSSGVCRSCRLDPLDSVEEPSTEMNRRLVSFPRS